MKKTLKISIGQYSSAGVKAQNQDFYAAYIPQPHLLQQKGMVCAIADGISSSNVSHIAAETAVSSFISDYYSTSDAWSTQTSAERVIRATNSWLYAQSQQSHARFDADRGYVCTFSALIFKQHQAHMFHIGDSRIYRIRAGQIEQLSHDHRVNLSATTHYLSRALGVDYRVDVDYRSVEMQVGDLFLLMTDGVYEFISDQQLVQSCSECTDLMQLAEMLVHQALEQGSDDNLTLQILRVDELAEDNAFYLQQDYQFPAELNARDQLDGYVIDKILHQNHRSCIYLAHDAAHKPLVIKTLAQDLQQDAQAVEQFQLEEWISKRLKHENLLQSYTAQQEKSYLYQCYEYIAGQSLDRWLNQQKQPLMLHEILTIVQQTALALNAMHRLEMLHQDVRPENIMCIATAQGMKIKLIDYGATAVRGLVEINPKLATRPMGTLAFMAPEYFIGHAQSVQSDQYSLAALTYYLLSKQLPYATELAQCKHLKQQKQLHYRSLLKLRPDLPVALDAVLAKALSIEAHRRYADLSEFIYALQHLQPDAKQAITLLEKNPLRFWQICSAVLLLALLLSLAWHTL